jgi:large conductance mechanosensitive channel
MLKGFREFVLRGNVVDMAVGVVIGAAFGSIVTAFVKDLLTPLIAALVGKPDFSAYSFEAHGAKFLYGDFINAVVAFFLIAAAVYYFVVLPVNALMARLIKKPDAAPDKKQCPECLSDIPIAAHKCAYCTSPVA